jgi:hypothetical protein
MWDEENADCIILKFDPSVRSYYALNYATKNDMGIYAYSTKCSIGELIELYDELVDIGRFRKSELFFNKIINIKYFSKK